MLALIVCLLSNSVYPVSAKENDKGNNQEKKIFQITPNESLDISLLESEGIAKYQKTTHPSKDKAEATTTMYYIDDVNTRKQLNDKIVSELSDVDEMQAQYTDSKYKTDFDSTYSYEVHYTVYWTIYVDYMGTQGRIDQVSGGYTQRDWTISVVSQYLSVGAYFGADSTSYNTYLSPSNSNWTVYTYDKVRYIPINDTNPLGSMGGIYYDIELKRNAGSWIKELAYTCWGYGPISLYEFLGR
jgi:hypothetical protein